MRADKRCKTCEWWDIEGPIDYNKRHACLRWPGESELWLWTNKSQRCWQYVKRTSETEESLEILPEDQERMLTNANPGMMVRARIRREGEDLRDAARLVIEAGLATGHADTCVDLVSEVLKQVRELQERAHPKVTIQQEDIDAIERQPVGDLPSSLAHARLRLALARKLLDEAYGAPALPEKWQEQADAWLNVKD